MRPAPHNFLSLKKMEAVKSAVANFNQAEVLHLLNHIFKTRDDVLFLYAMTRQEIHMDEASLHDFKAWLLENRDIVMACIESSLPTNSSGGETEDNSDGAAVGSGSGSNAAGGGGGGDC